MYVRMLCYRMERQHVTVNLIAAYGFDIRSATAQCDRSVLCSIDSIPTDGIGSLDYARPSLINVDAERNIQALEQLCYRRHRSRSGGIREAAELGCNLVDKAVDIQLALEAEIKVVEREVDARARLVHGCTDCKLAEALVADGEAEAYLLDIGQFEIEVEQIKHGADERLVDGEAEEAFGDLQADGHALRNSAAGCIGGVTVCSGGGFGYRGCTCLLVVNLTDIRAEQRCDALELDFAEAETFRIDVCRVVVCADFARLNFRLQDVDVVVRSLGQSGGTEQVQLKQRAVEGIAQFDGDLEVAQQQTADAVEHERAEVEVRFEPDGEVDIVVGKHCFDYRRAIVSRACDERLCLLLTVDEVDIFRRAYNRAFLFVGAVGFQCVDGTAVLDILAVGHGCSVHCKRLDKDGCRTKRIGDKSDDPACERIVVIVIAGLKTFARHREVDVGGGGQSEIAELAGFDVRDVSVVRKLARELIRLDDGLVADVELLDIERRRKAFGKFGIHAELGPVDAVCSDLDVADVGQLDACEGVLDAGVLRADLGEDCLHRGQRELQREVAGVDERTEVGVIMQSHVLCRFHGGRNGFGCALGRRTRYETEQIQSFELDLHAFAEQAAEVGIERVVEEVHLKHRRRACLFALGVVVVTVDFQPDLHICDGDRAFAAELDVGVEHYIEVRAARVAEVTDDVDGKTVVDEIHTEIGLDCVNAEDEVDKRTELDIRTRHAVEAHID